MTPNEIHRRPRVLIIGGGFAGIHAGKALGKVPVDVTVIDRRNHFTFQPLLYQVGLAVLSPANIAEPIRGILRDNTNTEVLMDEAIGVDSEHRRVQFRSGAEMSYDYLMLATGATHSYFGNDKWEPLAPGLKTIEDAIEIRRRILLAFELAEREMLETGSHHPLNFVVIGGGPTGVELAGAICDISRRFMRHDFRHIDPSKSRVILIEGEKHVLSAYPVDLSIKAEEQLKALGVEVYCGLRVTDVQPGYVIAGQQRFDSAVTLWAAGVQASPLGKLLGAPTDKRGCVSVNNTLNPDDHPEIFICGDLAHFEENGHQVPGVAQPAMQMGDHVARMIAVAKVEWPFKAHWSGFPAWITWLVVHIYFLIGFRNRLAVLWQWVWSYFTFTYGVRLIYGSQALPGWTTPDGAEVHPGALNPASPVDQPQAPSKPAAAD
jgi:NADH dehydrogenase